MKTVLILATAALSAVTLAGCGKGGGAKPAASATPVADAIGGAGGPMRKAGLWAISRVRDGKPAEGPASGMKTCIDAKSDAQMGMMGGTMTRAMCPEQSLNRNIDGSWNFAATCHMGPGGTTKTTGSASGDFASKYVVHSESDTEGSQFTRMNGHHVTDLTATYQGPCPADMAPGDVLLPNGMKINPAKMMAGAGHLPGTPPR